MATDPDSGLRAFDDSKAGPELTLRTTLCRFTGNILFKKLMPVKDTVYIAVSHVWGEAKWQKISGVIEDEVLVSPEKAKFIKDQLPQIVGTQWFWMDILSIDQRDKAARIAITQYIPTIFRCAQRTTLVRSSAGVRKCCAQTLGDREHFVQNQGDCVDALDEHFHDGHHTGEHDELVLSRLWVFQEILLSDCIQFERCEEMPVTSDKDLDLNKPLTSFISHVLVNLQTVAGAWIFYRNSVANGIDRKLQSEFIHAFLTCGTVEMKSSKISRPIPTAYELMTNYHSTRKTSHARDFILAVMPQYEFYTVPGIAKNMSFGELFVDCIQQAQRKGFPYAPLVGQTFHLSNLGQCTVPATDNIPEPECLGDMVKLLFGYRPLSGLLQPATTGYPSTPVAHVSVKLFKYPNDVRETMNVIKETLIRADMMWTNVTTSLGDMRYLELEERNRELYSAIMILRICNSPEFDHSIAENLLTDYPDLKISVIRLAALISCGLGISALTWSKDNQTLVTVDFRGHSILALVPISVARSPCAYFLYEGEQYWPGKERFHLLACYQNWESEECQPCLFPLIYLFDEPENR